MNIVLKLAIVIMSLYSTQCFALEYSRLGGTFLMVGSIDAGESDAFIEAIKSWDVPPAIFHIDSEGGDLVEAMKIGRMIRESHIPVWSGERCYSACFFIFSSGIERNARGVIGLHRPYFDPEYYSGLDLGSAEVAYNALTKKASDYLKSMGVGSSLIEEMFRFDSDSIKILNPQEAMHMIGARAPYYDEWLAAKCGRYTDSEAEVVQSLLALQALGIGMKVLIDPDLKKGDGFSESLSENYEKAELARALHREGKIQPYIELFESRTKCIRRIENKHVFDWHHKVKGVGG